MKSCTQPCICPQSLTFTLHLVTSACQHCLCKDISSLVLAFSSRQGAASVIECYFLIMWTLITDRDADSVKGLSHNQPAKQYAKVWEATSKWCSSLVLKWNNVRQIQQETNLSVPLLYFKLQKWKIKFKIKFYTLSQMLETAHGLVLQQLCFFNNYKTKIIGIKWLFVVSFFAAEL